MPIHLLFAGNHSYASAVKGTTPSSANSQTNVTRKQLNGQAEDRLVLSNNENNKTAKAFLEQKNISTFSDLKHHIQHIRSQDWHGWYEVANKLRHLYTKPANEGAHAIYDRLMKLSTLSKRDRSFCLIGKAKIHDRTDRPNQAKDHYLSAIQVDPQHALAHLLYAGFLSSKPIFRQDRSKIDHYRQTLRLAEAVGDYGLQAKAYIGLGNARDGNWIDHYNNALDLAIAAEDKGLQAQAHIGLGDARDKKQTYHYRQALNLAEQIDNKGLKAQALIGLGNVLSAMRQNRDAAHCFEQAIACASNNDLKQNAQNGLNRVSRFLR